MSSNFEWLLMEYGSAGDAEELFTLARELEKQGKFRIAATAYDRAFGLEPDNNKIVMARKQLLERLAVVEHGIKFCYIPAGSFLMGFDKGDPDEQPVHPVQLDGYWISEIPISWTVYICYMGEPEWEDRSNTIRTRYCATDTTNHLLDDWTQYDEKPMVGVSWSAVERLCGKISTMRSYGSMILYRLPTEAEWEKAARGGLINCKYPWGDEIPNENTCDFNNFERFSILPSRSLPPNNYGLHGMSGGVWEWTQDWYDALYYRISPRYNPKGPLNGREKVVRGGSWADCAETVTVSFRMSRTRGFTPNIGFRLCRVERNRTI